MSAPGQRFVVRWTAPDGETGLCLADGARIAVMSAERAKTYAEGMTATSSTGTVYKTEPAGKHDTAESES